MNNTIELAPVADLTPFVGEGELVAVNVGADGLLYAVFALKRLDYRTEGPGATFAKATPDEPQAYRVLAWRNGQVALNIHIPQERFNIHDVQPLPGGDLLLVCGRASYRGANDYDRNGRVYSSAGELVREILLGDGIESVQATSKGLIWTSFFDEGVFGNRRWDKPVGSSGLVAWNSQGSKVYEYAPGPGLDSICDCYAMNVESDSSTWLYYYTEFPLVHLRDLRIASHWAMPLRGSNAFAISGELALFRGGYKQRDDYHLFELGKSGGVRQMGVFTLIDEGGNKLVAERAFGRSRGLYILSRHRVYQCDVEMAAAAR